MRKSTIKSALLAALALLVIVSLVGCVQMQKKTVKEDEPAASIDVEPEEPADVEPEEPADEEPEQADEAPEKETAEETADEAPESNATEDETPVKQVTEGQLVSFPNLAAVDPDGDKLFYEFSEPLNDKGEWQTKEGDAGEYTVTITVSDGKNKVSQQVKILVKALNNAPVISLSSDKVEVNEGDKITLDAKVTDLDNDPVQVKYEGWMKGPEKETTYDDAGEHLVTIIANDGKEETKQVVIIKVNNVNRAPKIETISDVALTEGDKVTIKPVATDPDGDKLTYEFSKPLDSDGAWTTKQGDVGKYRANVTVSDGDKTATSSFFIVVESMNKAPSIELALTEISVDEGDVVTIDAKVTDPEDDELTITYSGWMTTYTYTTDYDDSGVHVVTVTASDGINTVSKDISVIVRDKNRPPVFDTGAFD